MHILTITNSYGTQELIIYLERCSKHHRHAVCRVTLFLLHLKGSPSQRAQWSQFSSSRLPRQYRHRPTIIQLGASLQFSTPCRPFTGRRLPMKLVQSMSHVKSINPHLTEGKGAASRSGNLAFLRPRGGVKCKLPMPSLAHTSGGFVCRDPQLLGLVEYLYQLLYCVLCCYESYEIGLFRCSCCVARIQMGAMKVGYIYNHNTSLVHVPVIHHYELYRKAVLTARLQQQRCAASCVL